MKPVFCNFVQQCPYWKSRAPSAYDWCAKYDRTVRVARDGAVIKHAACQYEQPATCVA